MRVCQGANDDDAFSIGSSDVCHAMSAQTATDTYFRIKKTDASAGGALLDGYRDCNGSPYGALWIRGNLGEAACTNKGVGAYGIITVDARIRSGSSATTVGTNGNLFSISSNTCTKFIVDREGDVHYDGSTNASAWDEYCDVQLLTASRAVLMPECADFRKRFSGVGDDHSQTLHDTGVITLNDDGHHFISIKGLNGLMIDSIRQVNERVIGLETQLKALTEGK